MCTRKKKFEIMLLSIVLVIVVFFETGHAADQTLQASKNVPIWRMAAPKAGTSGHAAAIILSRIVDKYVPEVKIVATPTPGSERSYYLADQGEIEMSYGGALVFKQSWINEGVFEKNPINWKCYQGVSFFSVKKFYAKMPDRKDLNSWRDLAGKKVFQLYPGSGVWAEGQIYLGPEGLNIRDKIKFEKMDMGLVTDALKDGKVDTVHGYIMGGGLPGYFLELDARIDWEVLEPTEEELNIITKYPLFNRATLPSSLFRAPQKKESTRCYTNLPNSFNFAPDMDTGIVYKVVKAWFEHKEEMLKMNPIFTQFTQEPFKLQSDSINAMPEIPIHAGVAKYLKEVGQWKESWKEGKYYTRKEAIKSGK